MGTISASTGLNSGIDIAGTISKLMAINSQPVTALTTTDTTLTNQETAVTQLSALLLSVQDITQDLGQGVDLRQPDRHQQRPQRTGGHRDRHPGRGHLSIYPSANGPEPAISELRLPKRHHGPGRRNAHFPLRQHASTRASVLSDINGGQGFTAGEIRITDRSGASAVINLSNAQNIDDVLQAINTRGHDQCHRLDRGRAYRLDRQHGAKRLGSQSPGSQRRHDGRLAGAFGNRRRRQVRLPAQNILTLSSNLSAYALNDGMGVQTNSSVLARYQLHPARRHLGHDRPLADHSRRIDRRAIDPGRLIKQISTPNQRQAAGLRSPATAEPGGHRHDRRRQSLRHALDLQ